MHHELAARGFKHGASSVKAVAAAVSQSPLDAVTAQKMRVALGELGRGKDFVRGRRYRLGSDGGHCVAPWGGLTLHHMEPRYSALK